jgi:hypothetical protein
MNSRRTIVGLVLLGCGALLVQVVSDVRGGEGDRPVVMQAGLSTPGAGTSRNEGGTESISQPLVPKSCTAGAALAPNDWTVECGEFENGVSMDMRSKNGSMAACYGVLEVEYVFDATGNDVYGSATPERFIETAFVQGNEVSDFRIETPRPGADGHKFATWSGMHEGRAVRGFVEYRSWPSGTHGSYMLALRLGWTPASQWTEMQPLIYHIARSAHSAKPFPGEEVPSGGELAAD